MPPSPSSSWNSVQAFSPSASVSASKPPLPAAGSATRQRFDLLEQDQLRVAREPAGEGVGKAERRRERQHRHAIGAADPGREGGDRAAQEIDPRVAPRRHAPRGLGVQPDRLRRDAAGFLDPRPEPTQRAQLRDGEELVGVGDHQEREGSARLGERQAGALEGAQIGDAGRKRGGELLRLARAGLVIGARVDAGRRACEARLAQAPRGLGHAGGKRLKRHRRRGGAADVARRVEAEIDSSAAGSTPRRLTTALHCSAAARPANGAVSIRTAMRSSITPSSARSRSPIDSTFTPKPRAGAAPAWEKTRASAPPSRSARASAFAAAAPG